MTQSDKILLKISISISMHIKIHELCTWILSLVPSLGPAQVHILKMQKNTATFNNSKAIQICILHYILKELQVLVLQHRQQRSKYYHQGPFKYYVIEKVGGWVRPNAYVFLHGGWVGIERCIRNKILEKKGRFKTNVENITIKL